MLFVLPSVSCAYPRDPQRSRAVVGPSLGDAHGSGGGRLTSFEFIHSACLDSIAHLQAADIIPRIFRIMDTSAVTGRTLQGMTRVRSRVRGEKSVETAV